MPCTAFQTQIGKQAAIRMRQKESLNCRIEVYKRLHARFFYQHDLAEDMRLVIPMQLLQYRQY